MKLDDLKQDWQETIEAPSDLEDLSGVIAKLEKETDKIDKDIKRRDRLEIAVAYLLIPAWLYGLTNSAGWLQSVGYISAIISCIYVPYRLLKAKKVTSKPNDSFRSFLENEKQKVSQQKALLESVVFWYIAPLFLSIILITLGGTVDEFGMPQMNEKLAIYYGFLLLFSVGIYFMNKRVAKKKLGPLLTKIEQRLSELESQNNN